jgi:hypothetical protein
MKYYGKSAQLSTQLMKSLQPGGQTMNIVVQVLPRPAPTNKKIVLQAAICYSYK